MKRDLDYLRLLAKSFPSADAAAAEIIQISFHTPSLTVYEPKFCIFSRHISVILLIFS